MKKNCLSYATRSNSLILLLLLFPVALRAQEIDPVAVRNLPDLSTTVIVEDGQTPAVFPENTIVRWQWRPTLDDDFDFVRLHIRVRSFSAVNDWRLLIKDDAGNTLEEIRPASFFGVAPNAQFWTRRIERKKFRVQLVSNTNPVGLSLEIDRLIRDFFLPGPRSITTGRNDMKNLVSDPAYTRSHIFYTYSQPIVAIFFVKVTGTAETNCTGFLLTPEVVITNQHCISQDWQLHDARVIFNYENNPVRTETFGIRKIAIPPEVALDFTLLELDRPANGWPTVKIDLNPVSNDQKLVLIEHPNKRFKTVSEIDCTVEKAHVDDLPDKPNDFYHLCDTEGGASGSPVMNRSSGRVVGLHHLGITDAVFNQGRNLAVKMGPILKRVHDVDPELYARIMQYTQ